MATPARPTTTTPATGALPAYANDPSKANLDSLAGAMKGPTTYTPSEKSLVSNQLSTLLNSDSPYLTAARTRAAQLANGRGLLNSSMAAGAGEAAAVESALPIAQQDAATYDTAQRFNADAANNFARDANSFGRQGALAKFQGVLDVGSQGRQIAAQDRQLGLQLGLQREQLGLQRDQLGLDEKFRRDQLNQATAQFKLDQTYTLDRMRVQQQYDLEKLGLQQKQQLPQQFAAGLASSTYDKVQAIIQDPNLKTSAKQVAIENAIAYANAMQSWGESFYGMRLPDFTAGQFVTSPTSKPSTTTSTSTSTRTNTTRDAAGNPIDYTGGA